MGYEGSDCLRPKCSFSEGMFSLCAAQHELELAMPYIATCTYSSYVDCCTQPPPSCSCARRSCSCARSSCLCHVWYTPWCAVQQVGFPRRDPARLQLALDNSHSVLWIRSMKQSRWARQGQLLGFARATSDGALSATIWDVAVSVCSELGHVLLDPVHAVHPTLALSSRLVHMCTRNIWQCLREFIPGRHRLVAVMHAAGACPCLPELNCMSFVCSVAVLHADHAAVYTD